MSSPSVADRVRLFSGHGHGSSGDNAALLTADSFSEQDQAHGHIQGTTGGSGDVVGPDDGMDDASASTAQPEVEIPDVDDGSGHGHGILDEDIDPNAEPPRPKFSWRLLWAYTGPGWLMSIAYLDPGNLESDLQAGAYTGYQLIWVLFVSTIIGLMLQILAARLGVVTGRHLAQVCRDEYATWLSRCIWIMTELAIIGSDIQEVIGSAIAFKILFGLPLWIGVLITACDTFTFLGLHAFGIRKLEALFATLIGTMCVCFFVNYSMSQPSFEGIMKGFLPDVSDYAVIQAVSIVGAVIMPHNIYLHSALVQSRSIDRTRRTKVREANYYFSIEASIALFVSFLINLAVVAVFSKGFFDPVCAEQGLARVTLDDGTSECDEIGLQMAGSALKKLLGNAASTVWAIGLLAAGQSSVMTGTFAGQYVMEGFLTLRLPAWKRVVVTRGLALVPATLVAVLTPEQGSGAHAGDTLDEYLNILQSIILPFALLPILHFTSSRRLMGAFVNSFWTQIFGWMVSISIMIINLYLVVTEILDTSVSGLPDTWWLYTILAITMAGYTMLVALVIRKDIKFWWRYIKRKWTGDRSLVAASDAEENGPRNSGVITSSENGVITTATSGPSSSTAAPTLSDFQALSELFDTPEVGSPAWLRMKQRQQHHVQADVHDGTPSAATAAGMHVGVNTSGSSSNGGTQSGHSLSPPVHDDPSDPTSPAQYVQMGKDERRE